MNIIKNSIILLLTVLIFSCEKKISDNQKTIEKDSLISGLEFSDSEHSFKDISSLSLVYDTIENNFIIYKSDQNKICLGVYKDKKWTTWEIFPDEQFMTFSAEIDLLNDTVEIIRVRWESGESGAGGGTSQKGIQLWDYRNKANILNAIVYQEANDFGIKDEEGIYKENTSKGCSCHQNIEIKFPNVIIEPVSCQRDKDESFNEMCSFEGLRPGVYVYNGKELSLR
jgi:hypothetical protein